MKKRKVDALFVSVALTFITMAFLQGCHSTSPLVHHNKWIVRGPSKFGEGIGALVVGPVVTLPALLIPHWAPGDGQQKAVQGLLDGSKPVFRVTQDYFFVPLFGGIPWLLFGWWGDNGTDYKEQPIIIIKEETEEEKNQREIKAIMNSASCNMDLTLAPFFRFIS
jgi:hypothetical protein